MRNNEENKEELLKSKEKQLVALIEDIKQDDDDNDDDDDDFSAYNRYEGRDNERLSGQENILRNLWQKNWVYRLNVLGKLILIT